MVFVDYLVILYVLIVVLMLLCLLEVGWYDDVFVFLKLVKICMWYYEKYVVEVLVW